MKIGEWILGRMQQRRGWKLGRGGVHFDREHQKPVIRSSICTGEQVAGFRDLRTGKFTEIMLVRNNEDMEEFTGKYGISREEITREW